MMSWKSQPDTNQVRFLFTKKLGGTILIPGTLTSKATLLFGKTGLGKAMVALCGMSKICLFLGSKGRWQQFVVYLGDNKKCKIQAIYYSPQNQEEVDEA